MAARRNDVRVILRILEMMADGMTGLEMAQELGYKAEDSIYRVIDEYDLRDVERRLKRLYGLQAAEIPEEVILVNEEYKEAHKEIFDRIKEIKLPEPKDDLPQNPNDELSFLNSKLGALSRSRSERLSVLGLQSESKRKKNQEAQDASRFEELLDE